jgi:thymidylate kinase
VAGRRDGDPLRPVSRVEHRLRRSPGPGPAWLADIQRYLPQPGLTILLDIAPETAVQRKAANRDRYERDLALLSRVRDSYRRQAPAGGWLHLDGERDKQAVAADVVRSVETRLSPP